MPEELRPSRSCPNCGRTIPPGADICPFCSVFIPGIDARDPRPMIEGQRPPYNEPTPNDTPPPDTFGVTSPPPPGSRSPLGLILLAVGLVFLATGVGLLIGGDWVAQSVQSFNQQCGQVPGCHPESNSSDSLYAGGFGLFVGGALLVALGFRRSSVPRTWDSTPETHS